MLLIPILVVFFRVTKAHYSARRRAVDADRLAAGEAARNTGHRPDQRRPARGGAGARLRADLVARRARGLHRRRPGGDRRRSATDWDKWGRGVPLVVLASPFRSLMEPLLEYIEQLDASSRTTTSRWCCPSSCPHDGGTTSSTTSAPCSSRARCSSSRTPSSPACLFTWSGKPWTPALARPSSPSGWRPSSSWSRASPRCGISCCGCPGRLTALVAMAAAFAFAYKFEREESQ